MTAAADDSGERRDRLRALVSMANAHNLPEGRFAEEIEREDNALLRSVLAEIREPTDYGAAGRRDAVVSLLQERVARDLSDASAKLSKVGNRVAFVGVLVMIAQLVLAYVVYSRTSG